MCLTSLSSSIPAHSMISVLLQRGCSGEPPTGVPSSSPVSHTQTNSVFKYLTHTASGQGKASFMMKVAPPLSISVILSFSSCPGAGWCCLPSWWGGQKAPKPPWTPFCFCILPGGLSHSRRKGSHWPDTHCSVKDDHELLIFLPWC